MAKNYNPPTTINEHAGVKLLDDKQRKTESKMIRIDAMRFALEVMSEQEKDLNNILVEAKKIEDYIEYGSLPFKKK